MKYVYLMLDEAKNVVAIYEDEAVAQKLKKPIEEKLNLTLTIEKRSVNPDLKVVGVLK